MGRLTGRERFLLVLVLMLSTAFATQPLFTPPAFAEQALTPCQFQVMHTFQEPSEPGPKGRGGRSASHAV
jgi:hypothetical protein